MVEFKYREFYDVPRFIILKYRGVLFFLKSAFDEELDEYPDTYSVYRLPGDSEVRISEPSWEWLDKLSMTPVGQIPIRALTFDSTKRKKFDASVLDGLFNEELGR